MENIYPEEYCKPYCIETIKIRMGKRNEEQRIYDVIAGYQQRCNSPNISASEKLEIENQIQNIRISKCNRCIGSMDFD